MIATLLILLVNILFGIKRGVHRGLLRLGTLLLAAVAAFFLAKGLSAPIGDVVMPIVSKAVASNEALSTFLAENPAAGESVGVLVEMLTAPLLFLLCYIVLKVITWVIYFILRSVFRIQKPKGLFSRVVGGAVMGLGAGLVGVLVFVTPVMGYTNLLSRTATEAENLAQSTPLAEYNEQYLAPAVRTPVASTLYNGIGHKLFKGLTTTQLNGTETDLENEWFAVINVVNEASKLKDCPVSEYGETEAAAVHAMAAGVGQSQLLCTLNSGVANGMANAWLKNEPFFGIGRPATGDESVDIILNGFLRVFATTNPDLIGEDLEYFADLFDLFIKYQVFSKIGEGGATDTLVVHLSSSGFLEEARALLAQNQRMQCVTLAISDAGMRLLVRELGDPGTYLEQHKDLLDNMSTALKESVENGQVNTKTLTTDLQVVLNEKNVSVPPAAVEIVAEGIADEFTAEELTQLSVEEITNRMIERFGTVENIAALTSAAGTTLPTP